MEDKVYYQSEIGLLEIRKKEKKISAVNFVNDNKDYNKKFSPLLRKCKSQLKEYFKGKRRDFTLSLNLEGTTFQQQVWRELVKIPFGETRTYLEIAEGIGNKKAVRAVGGAIGKNKVAILIPCHRVIGSDGSLTGYSGGIEKKEWLLKHESKILKKQGKE